MKNLTFILCFITFLNLGCLLPKYVPPKKLDESFTSMKIDKIGMLPTADLRQDASKPFKHASYLRNWLKKNLERRGYSTAFTGEENITISNAQISDLLNFDLKIEKFLGSSNYRYVFLPVLNETSSEFLGVGKRAEVSILGIIYDKDQKKVIWMNEAIGEDTGFMAMSAMSNVLAVDNAIGVLMSGMPKAKK